MAKITVDELKVVITADVKELDKALSKSNKSVKDYVKELKGTSKNTEEVGEKTEGLADGLASMAGGLLQGVTGLNLMGLGAVAAGAAVAKMTLEIAEASIMAYNKFSGMSEYLSVMTSQSNDLMKMTKDSVLSGGLFDDTALPVDATNTILAMATAVTGLNVQLNKLSETDQKGWLIQSAKVADLADKASVDAQELSNSIVAVTQGWQEFGITYGQAADVIYTATGKSGKSPIMLAQSIAEATPVFKAFDYTLGETAGIITRFAKANLDSTPFVRMLNQNFSMFGDNAEQARIEMESVIATVEELNKAGKQGELVDFLAKYGLNSNEALKISEAVRRGVFDGGAYEGKDSQGNDLVWHIPMPDIDNLDDILTLIRNSFEINVYSWINNIVKGLIALKDIDIPEKGSHNAPVEYQDINLKDITTKYENLMDVVNDLGFKYSREEISFLLENPNAYAKWKLDAADGLPPGAGTIMKNFSPFGSGGAGGTNFLDWLEKQLSTQQDSLLLRDMMNPQLIKASMPSRMASFVGKDEASQSMAAANAAIIKGPQVASAGWATDFGGYGLGINVKEAEHVSKDVITLSDRTSQAEITDSRLVLQHRLEDYVAWRRSSEIANGVVRAESRETAESASKSFYSLHTIFGDLDIDITEMSKSLAEWGINVPTLFDNILTGVGRIGNEMLDSTGLDATYDFIVNWVNDIKGTIDGLGIEFGTFWDMFVDKTELSMEDAAEALKGFNDDALSVLKETVGTVVMAISDMWATGTWNWKKLWNETFKSLLSLLINWGVKTILTMAATTEGIATINAILKAITGDWVGFGAAMAGLAIVVAGTAAWIAGIKAIGNALPDGTEKEEPGWWNPNEGQPKLEPAPGSGPSASSLSMPGRNHVVVNINNPNYMGQFSDSDAAAFAQAFGDALVVRGAVPQPIG